MIDAKELRLGNYLCINGVPQRILAFTPNESETTIVGTAYFKIVFAHYKHGDPYETYSDEEVEPVQLTSEWLLKFGFIKKYNYEYHFSKSPFSVILNPLKHDFLFNNFVVSTEIKYLHQLQNLYFALTGTELKSNDRSDRV